MLKSNRLWFRLLSCVSRAMGPSSRVVNTTPSSNVFLSTINGWLKSVSYYFRVSTSWLIATFSQWVWWGFKQVIKYSFKAPVFVLENVSWAFAQILDLIGYLAGGLFTAMGDFSNKAFSCIESKTRYPHLVSSVVINILIAIASILGHLGYIPVVDLSGLVNNLTPWVTSSQPWAELADTIEKYLTSKEPWFALVEALKERFDNIFESFMKWLKGSESEDSSKEFLKTLSSWFETVKSWFGGS